MKKQISNVKKHLLKHKYIYLFLLFFCSCLPYFFHFYPGIVIGDTYAQLKQALGIRAVSNHHPVFQTFLLWIFIKIGDIFNNDNLIIALNSLFQISMFSLITTYSIYFLDKNKIKNYLIIIFYLIYPVLGIYSIYTSKDTIFAFSILFFLIELAKFLKDPEKHFLSKKNLMLFLISSFLVMICKNNGVYIVILTFIIVIMCFRKYIKTTLKIFLLLITTYFIWNNVVLSFFNVKPTESVESLGLPLNQMHYIVYNRYNELKDGELINRLDKFIDVDGLRDKYVPKQIDGIKKYFNDNYFDKHRLKFFLLWFDFFKEYPRDCLKAFWEKNSILIAKKSKVRIAYIYVKDAVPIDLKMEPIIEIPYVDYVFYDLLKYNKKDYITFLIFHPSYNLDLLLLVSLILLLMRNKNLIMCIPLIVIWLTALAAPGTAYRYIYPSVMCLPYLVCYAFDFENKIQINSKKLKSKLIAFYKKRRSYEK